MKKIISIVLALFVMSGLVCVFTSASNASSVCYVTIVDGTGSVVLTQASVPVADKNDDGAFTIDEALSSAHSLYGSDDMYKSEEGQYGLSLVKLWGVENGGSYGYYVNDNMAWSLADEVSAGDHVVAFIYTDLQTWSDKYCFFDAKTVSGVVGDEVTLTLSYYDYDASYNLVSAPCADAAITMDGNATEYTTDENGSVTITLTDAGTHTISATSESVNIVTPVCVATVGAVDKITVYVTIVDGEKNIVMAQLPVEVSDANADGYYDIDEALYASHVTYYPDGASGYASTLTEYGLSLSMLWGVDNGGSYGYYVNNNMAWSLGDKVSDGDYINAFIYSDLSSWSDTYSFFEEPVIDADAGDEVTVALSYYTYDDQYNLVKAPLAGAVITINGEETEIVTDENGSAVLSFDDEGTYIISALSGDINIVPPVCTVTVSAKDAPAPTPADNTDPEPSENNNSNTNNTEKNPATGDEVYVLISVFVLSSLCAAVICSLRKKKNED